ncbi:hypothetical protein [Hyperthermus butylicus]|uniref:Uncharacterized protein n=1 Tax=Hyperthermus butylicus (strain DSM 5456 / JCM 9403 / PLM1-5) TaxID=415426 RepID=A2BJ79_HYPBU|nr:hypothetical protein [Hyperthermus butylicus]ABM80040.1 hypothetical protein Hbut_0168 [Hyperthermus butylicus DSM 5456]
MVTRRLDDYLRQLGTAVRERHVDVEALIRRLVEEAVAASSCNGARLDEVLERLEAIERRLDKLERTLEELRSTGLLTRRNIEELAQALASAVSAVLKQARQQRGGNEPRWVKLILERIEDRGYVFLHELPAEVRSGFDPGVLRSKGLIVESVGGDVLIASSKTLQEFSEELSKLKTSDEYEAEMKLGKYRVLFRILRDEGMVYYAAGRGWVLRGLNR